MFCTKYIVNEVQHNPPFTNQGFSLFQSREARWPYTEGTKTQKEKLIMFGFSKLALSLVLSSFALADAVKKCCTCGSSSCHDQVEKIGKGYLCSPDASDVSCETLRDLVGSWHCDSGYDCAGYLPLGHQNRDYCCQIDPLANPPDRIDEICSNRPRGRCKNLLPLSRGIESVCENEYSGAVCGKGRRGFGGGELRLGLL